MQLHAKRAIKGLNKAFREYKFSLGKHVNGGRYEGFRIKVMTPEGMIVELRTLLLLDATVNELKLIQGEGAEEKYLEAVKAAVGEELDRFVTPEEDDE